MRISLVLVLAITLPASLTATSQAINNDKIVSYIADPQKQDVQFYWKNDSGKIFRSIQNLKHHLEQKNRQLIFAMNGGMYQTDNSPLGLYIENYKTITRLNTRSASGNFYMKPIGILPDNRILFAMSKVPVNFYEFAEFFKSQGCSNALYLDGAISQTFLPEKNWVQTGGNFGVIIGVSRPN